MPLFSCCKIWVLNSAGTSNEILCGLPPYDTIRIGILRIEPNAVKVRLHRARTRLKEKMETFFVEEVKDIY